jgi:hypothetical protein
MLEAAATMPADGTQVGVFGYPGAIKIPLGRNYMASPEHFLDRSMRRVRHAGMSRSRISLSLPRPAPRRERLLLFPLHHAPVRRFDHSNQNEVRTVN